MIFIEFIDNRKKNIIMYVTVSSIAKDILLLILYTYVRIGIFSLLYSSYRTVGIVKAMA